MKSYLIIALASILTLTGCSTKEAPIDSSGNKPDQVLLDTYKLIVDGKFDEAQKNFSPDYIETFITSKNTTFEEYCSKTKGWTSESLKTEVMGNDYNDNLWRVKIYSEINGSQNGPGIVQDLYIIDGEWVIVFWNHYPKS